MRFSRINSYADYVAALRQVGFSLASHNPEGIFSLSSSFGPKIHWHTGDPDSDPWQFRVRIMEECPDIAYGSVFLRKHGFITREWYPRFMALRRPLSLEQAYREGRISTEARTIYAAIAANAGIPVHELKSLLGSLGRSKGFERALVDLQMWLYCSMSGNAQKISRRGEAYGWPSACYALPETLFGPELEDEAADIDPEEAKASISDRILEVNPEASAKDIKRFLRA